MLAADLGRAAATSNARIGEATAMPADHGVGTDDYEHVGPACPNARETRPEDSVCALELEPFGPGTAENHKLLAEGKVLQSQCPAGAEKRTQEPDEGDEHGEHPLDSAPGSSSPRGFDSGEAQAAKSGGVAAALQIATSRSR
jgi:hypothetical protein